jgi:hypothetical protein
VYSQLICLDTPLNDNPSEASEDAGRTYRTVLNQEYAFSPGGATFQREDIRLRLATVSHVRLTIVPNKGGSGKATLTSLRVQTRLGPMPSLPIPPDWSKYW